MAVARIDRVAAKALYLDGRDGTPDKIICSIIAYLTSHGCLCEEIYNAIFDIVCLIVVIVCELKLCFAHLRFLLIHWGWRKSQLIYSGEGNYE